MNIARVYPPPFVDWEVPKQSVKQGINKPGSQGIQTKRQEFVHLVTLFLPRHYYGGGYFCGGTVALREVSS